MLSIFLKVNVFGMVSSYLIFTLVCKWVHLSNTRTFGCIYELAVDLSSAKPKSLAMFTIIIRHLGLGTSAPSLYLHMRVYQLSDKFNVLCSAITIRKENLVTTIILVI